MMIETALILSDIHLEFDVKRQQFQDIFPEKMADAVFLAGDIAGGMHALPFIDHLLELEYTVFYCLGNHEFYGHDIDDLVAQWRSVNKERFHFLHRDVVEVDNLRVVGAPLWASVETLAVHPFSGFQRRPLDWFVRQHIKGCADFEHIKDFSPERMADEFWKDLAFFEAALEEPSDKTTVVLSHYLPSFDSVHPAYQGKLSNAIFASELDPLIAQHNIALWVHGHTHVSFEYDLHGTRVVCNPRGYHDIRMLNQDFDWQKIVTLSG